jgi:hypothetical protein
MHLTRSCSQASSTCLLLQGLHPLHICLQMRWMPPSVVSALVAQHLQLHARTSCPSKTDPRSATLSATWRLAFGVRLCIQGVVRTVVCCGRDENLPFGLQAVAAQDEECCNGSQWSWVSCQGMCNSAGQLSKSLHRFDDNVGLCADGGQSACPIPLWGAGGRRSELHAVECSAHTVVTSDQPQAVFKMVGLL